MEKNEKIDYLRSHADISYDTAYEILEGTDWDIGTAEESLKKEGIYREENTIMTATDNNYTKGENKSIDLKNGFKKVFSWLGNLIVKGMENDFCIYTEKGKCIALPLTILAVFALAAFPVVLIVLLITFFTGCRFGLKGPQTDYCRANDLLSKVRFECR